jgi:hypothetical protein
MPVDSQVVYFYPMFLVGKYLWSWNPITACRPHSLRSGIHGLGLNVTVRNLLAFPQVNISVDARLLAASWSRDLDHKDFTKASQTSLKPSALRLESCALIVLFSC